MTRLNAQAKSPGPHAHVFLSYSWDNEEHVAWVGALVTRLRQDGVPVTWDGGGKEGEAGVELSAFMESLADFDRVLVVCTPAYKVKADQRTGGVGYETRLLAARLIRDQRNTFAIPLLREGTWERSGPRWLGSALYLDFRGDSPSDSAYRRLTEILGSPKKVEAPPAIRVPAPPPLKLGSIWLWVLLLLAAITLYLPLHGPLAVAIATSRQELAALHIYEALTVVRFVGSCALLAGSVWLSRWEYRAGISIDTVSGRVRTVAAAGVLAGSTCFSSLLNINLFFHPLATAKELAWPERLCYVYLAIGFLALASSLWRLLAVHPGRQ